MLTLNAKSMGFSLIELMITLSIVGILSSLAFPQYMIWIQDQRIRNAAESIQNGLQKARGEAIKRNTWVRFVLGTNSAWRIECVITVGDLDTDGLADCPAIIEERLTSEGSSSQISVTSTPTSTTTVIFTNLGLVQTTAPSSAPFTPPFTRLSIQNSIATGTRPLEVRLGLGGSTRMCDPDTTLALTDPRRC